MKYVFAFGIGLGLLVTVFYWPRPSTILKNQNITTSKETPNEALQKPRKEVQIEGMESQLKSTASLKQEIESLVASEMKRYQSLGDELRKDTAARCSEGYEFACVLATGSHRQKFLDAVYQEAPNHEMRKRAQELMDVAGPLCRKGYSKACINMTFVFTNLKGEFAEEEKWFEELMRARCAAVYDISCSTLRIFLRYRNASRFEINELNRKSCTKGDVPSCSEYGRSMFAENIRESIWAYNRMCSLEISQCGYALDRLPPKEVDETVLSRAEKHCLATSKDCHALGRFYQESDRTKSAEYFQRTCLKTLTYCSDAIDQWKSLEEYSKVDALLNEVCPRIESKKDSQQFYADLFVKYCK